MFSIIYIKNYCIIITWCNIAPFNGEISVTIPSDLGVSHTKGVEKLMFDNAFGATPLSQREGLGASNLSDVRITPVCFQWNKCYYLEKRKERKGKERTLFTLI